MIKKKKVAMNTLVRPLFNAQIFPKASIQVNCGTYIAKKKFHSPIILLTNILDLIAAPLAFLVSMSSKVFYVHSPLHV